MVQCYHLLAVGATAGAAATVLLAYLLSDREYMSAADFRARSGYSVASLSRGTTAYQIEGTDDAPVVVIVHGGTIGSVAYKSYVLHLVKAGYRVLIYDQYGRGFSDRPAVPLTIDLLREQLVDLLDYLQVDKAFLFGVSLGGAVVARFAAQHGHRVRALAFQAPVVTGVKLSPAIVLARTPILGRLLGRFYVIPAIISRGRSIGTHTEEARRIFKHFTAQFLVKGTERMMREMLAGDALSSRMKDHIAIGARGIRAQFSYASDDSEIAPEVVEEAITHYHNPDVQVYTGGHFFSTGQMGHIAHKLDVFFQDNNK